jgi:hypothetical protein
VKGNLCGLFFGLIPMGRSGGIPFHGSVYIKQIGLIFPAGTGSIGLCSNMIQPINNMDGEIRMMPGSSYFRQIYRNFYRDARGSSPNPAEISRRGGNGSGGFELGLPHKTKIRFG